MHFEHQMQHYLEYWIHLPMFKSLAFSLDYLQRFIGKTLMVASPKLQYLKIE